MRVNIKSNIKEVTKGLSSMQKKQIPFATMLALNDTAPFMLTSGSGPSADKSHD